MRIHRLEFAAIGPFPGRHRIDVDAVAAHGLFLLEGPTGAGKSTILDAVVFALYGVPSSSESSPHRLHSAHAPADAEPFVEMVFSTAAGRYRVRRTPAHRRPKRRGPGHTEVHPTAQLWRLSGDDDAGEPVCRGPQEVGHELTQILGLTRDQFTQTVVLPQGQFAAFLRAKPEDRRAVLQQIFGTEVFAKVQEQLADMARAGQGRVDRAEAGLAHAVAALREAAQGRPEPDDLADRDEGPSLPEPPAWALAEQTLDPAPLTALAEDCARHWAGRAEIAEHGEASAASAARRRRHAADAARQVADRLARRQALLAHQEELAAEAPQLAHSRQQLAAAEAAEALRAVISRHGLADAELADAAAQVAEQVRALAHSRHGDLLADGGRGPGGRWQLSEKGVRRLAEASSAAADERGALKPVLALEGQLAQRQAGLNRDQGVVAALRTQAAAAERDAAERVQARPALVAALARAQAAAADLPSALDELGRARDDVTLCARLAELDARLQQLTADQAAVATRCRQAARRHQDLHEAWVAGIAGELGATLRPDLPCPVCGSCEHPAPALPDQGQATREDVAAAAAGLAAADEAAQETHRRWVAARTEREVLGASRPDLTMALARRHVQEAGRRARQAEQAHENHPRLAAELDQHDIAVERARQSAQEAQCAVAAAAAQMEASQRQALADRRAIDAARRGRASVAELAEELGERLELADGLRDLLRRQEESWERREASAIDLTGALADAGFACAEHAARALLPAPQRQKLEELVSAHDRQAHAVAVALAAPDLAELTDGADADVVEAEARWSQAQDELTRATRRCVALRDVADRVEQRRHELAVALTARRDAVSQAAPALRMARLATGGEGNDQSLTLATFVILQRFEDVLRAANTRLSAMSDGRYAVRRTEGREGGQRARKTGLGLEILDHCTDTARDPKTLSGGETFYVCLCLALGLADVVTGEAGGIELGTLFIDEGFGSLDSATLDDVMAELTQLHDHGRRAVGLVSHVAELKQRITERIEVRRAPGGGSTLAVTGHAANATTDREGTMAAGNAAGGHGVAAEAHPRPAA